MTQHQLDLLPEALRARTNARVAASRNITFSILIGAVLVALVTHANFTLGRAEARLSYLSTQARQLDENAAQAERMQAELDRLDHLTQRYQQVALPINVSRIIAGVVEGLPESASFDALSISTDQTRGQRNAPLRGNTRTQRLLIAEVGGFAVDDRAIAEFVGLLDSTPPFQEVSLDFSRQGAVNGRSAREFRLSLTIDFDKQYEVRNQVSARMMTDAE